MTSEHWLAPMVGLRGDAPLGPMSRLSGAVQAPRARTWLWLSNSEQLNVDPVIFACDYSADLSRVRYLTTVLDRIEIRDGFPTLEEASGSLNGLYITGFSATRDFGPFFGFVKGSPASATLILGDLLSRN